MPKRPTKKGWIGIGVALLALVAVAAWLARPEPAPPDRGTGELMRAVVYHEYGPPDVLRLERVEKLLPNDHQVLVRVRAAAANPLDWHYVRGTPYLVRIAGAGLRRPKNPRIGTDLAGEVVAVGRAVTRFKPGDAVYGAGGGSFAEYARAREGRLAAKPANLTFEEAAAVPIAGLSALQGLRDKGRIRPGAQVLINGASGGVGTFAVQIAKAYGAEVTGVSSTRNVELVRSLGADHVVDYTKEDFTRGPRRYDLILDNVGNRSLSDLRRVMAPGGVHVRVGGGGPDENPWIGGFVTGPLKGLLVSPFVDQEFVTLLAEVTDRDLAVMKELIEAGKVRPVVDRTYALAEVPDAIRYLETGRARGKVVVRIDPPVEPGP